MTKQEAEAAFAAHVTTLAASLEQLDYYSLLGVARDGTADDVKAAYHRMAKLYHPDAHRTLHRNVKTCLHAIFKRMTEAYRVLYNFERRKRYDAQLAGGQTRMQDTGREKKGPRAPDADVKTPAGKRCFLAALKAIKDKDYKNAKLQLQLALTHEGSKSEPVLAKMKELAELMGK
jgi:DnaJ-class molecular chaperone